MIAAEHKLYKGRYGSRHWSSSILAKAAQNYLLLKKQQRHLYLNGNASNDDFDKIENEVAEAYVYLCECQKKARENRDEILEYNAAALSGEWNSTLDQVKKVILNAEKSQRMFAKLKYAMKARQTPLLKTLLILKTTESTKGDEWEDIVDLEQIYELLLEKNAKIKI